MRKIVAGFFLMFTSAAASMDAEVNRWKASDLKGPWVTAVAERATARFTVSVPAFAPLQMPLPERDYGNLAVPVTSGGSERSRVGYGSTVDNESRDAWSSLMRSFP